MAEFDVRDWTDQALAGINGASNAEVEQALKLLQVRAAAEHEDLGEPPVQSLGEYLANELPEPPAIVLPGQVVRGGITCTTSPGGKGKTTMSLNRLLRWSMGKPMFDDLKGAMVPTGPLKSLIIENEGSAGFFQSRVQLLAEKGMAPLTDDETQMMHDNVLIWGDGGWSDLKLDDEHNVALVRRAAEIHKPDIIFLEPFRTLWKGDENDATEMSVVIDALNGIAVEYDCAIMLTHHERKSGAGEGGEGMFAARGSAVLSDLVGVMERWRPVEAGKLRELSWTKWRFAEPAAPVRMRFDAMTWRYQHVAEGEQAEKVLTLIEQANGEWLHTNDIIEQTGDDAGHVRNILKKLHDEKRVKSTAATRQPGTVGAPGKMWRSATSDDNNGMEF